MNEVFVDTSIQIARFFHSPEKKRRIEERLNSFSEVFTGLVAKQEYKNRVLKTARYLLLQLESHKSFKAVRRHVDDHLSQNPRLRNICAQLLDTVHESSPNETDEDLTDRARSQMRNLLRLGLDDFENSVTGIIDDSGCACARLPVIEKEAYKTYEFGAEQCRKVSASCGIKEFMHNRKSDLKKILTAIQRLSEREKTAELKRIEEFIEKVLLDHSISSSLNACLKVGDLMIALESVNFEHFYTMNIKESKPLCHALGQTLIVRPSYATKEDEFYPFKVRSNNIIESC